MQIVCVCVCVQAVLFQVSAAAEQLHKHSCRFIYTLDQPLRSLAVCLLSVVYLLRFVRISSASFIDWWSHLQTDEAESAA